MISKNGVRIAAVCVVFGLLVAACGGGDDPAPAAEGAKSGADSSTGGIPKIVSDKAPEQTKLTIPSVSSSVLLLTRMVAQHAGIFKKHGLEIDVIDTPSSQTVELFLSGTLKFGAVDGSKIAPIMATGTPIELYAITGDRSNYGFYVQPKIKKLADLKGGVVGISGFGGLPERISNRVFEKYGFDRGQVTIQPVQNVGAIVQGMVAGEIDAGAFGSPFASAAEAAGMTLLYSPKELDIAAIQNPVVGDPAWVTANPNTARAFMRAWLEALWVIHTDPDEAKAALAAENKLDVVKDAKILEDSYDEALLVFRHPDKVAEGMDKMLPVFFENFDEPARIKDQKALLPKVDLVKELRAEGFFKALEAEYGPITTVRG